jgi:hypothetical protein
MGALEGMTGVLFIVSDNAILRLAADNTYDLTEEQPKTSRHQAPYLACAGLDFPDRDFRRKRWGAMVNCIDISFEMKNVLSRKILTSL